MHIRILMFNFNIQHIVTLMEISILVINCSLRLPSQQEHFVSFSVEVIALIILRTNYVFNTLQMLTCFVRSYTISGIRYLIIRNVFQGLLYMRSNTAEKFYSPLTKHS